MTREEYDHDRVEEDLARFGAEALRAYSVDANQRGEMKVIVINKSHDYFDYPVVAGVYRDRPEHEIPELLS